MSAYDDWIVNFKVNTSPLDTALRKVEQLRQAMNGLHGPSGSLGGGLGGYTRRTGASQLSPEQEQAKRMREFQQQMRYAQHNERLQERYDREQQREFNANIRSIRQQQQRRQAYEQEQRRVGLQEVAARREDARRRQRDVDLAESQAHRENRWRNQQSRQAEAQARRDRTTGIGVMSRDMILNRMEQRMNRYGVGDRTELGNIRQALGAARNQSDIAALAPRMREFNIATNEAIRHQQSLERQLNRNSFATRAMSNSMANFARSYLSVYAVIGGAKSLYNNAKQMEAMQIKLLMGTGSKSEAANEYAYIRGKAKETGSNINTMTDLYSQMAITGKDTGMSKGQLRKVFEDTTTMQIGYGMNPEQQKLVTKAIVQMMSFSE